MYLNPAAAARLRRERRAAHLHDGLIARLGGEDSTERRRAHLRTTAPVALHAAEDRADETALAYINGSSSEGALERALAALESLLRSAPDGAGPA